jgi:hypothetical protein
LVGCLGSEPRPAESQKRHFAGAYVKPPRLGVGECGPCPDFASYTLAFAIQLRKIAERNVGYKGKLKEVWPIRGMGGGE